MYKECAKSLSSGLERPKYVRDHFLILEEEKEKEEENIKKRRLRMRMKKKSDHKLSSFPFDL